MMFETIKVSDGFDLRYEVNGYTNGWHDEKPTEENYNGFSPLIPMR